MDGKQTFVWFGAFVTVVALAGAAGGVLLDRYVLRPPARAFGPGFRPGQGGQGPGPGLGRGGPQGMGRGAGPGGMTRPGFLNERLANELKLTTAQREKLDAVLRRRRATLDEVRSEMQTRMQAEQDALRAEIRALLDPGQQKRFDEAMARTPRPGEPGLGGPGPGRGGPGPRPGGPGSGRGRRGMPPGPDSQPPGRMEQGGAFDTMPRITTHA